MSDNFSPLPVLYISDAVLVIDKPAGLLSLPDGYDRSAPHVRRLLEPAYGRVWMVHRLDRETSGVLLLARTAEAHRALNIMFDTRQVQKIYHALVVGSSDWDERTVDLPLRVNVGHKHRTAVDPVQGKPAVTRLRVLERFAEYALLEAAPETGRTHQIRAHLAAIGHPVLADELYGDPPGDDARLLMPRLALHARRLTIEHPLDHTSLTFEAPYPADFVQALERLRERALNR